jgi:hypothetical protein
MKMLLDNTLLDGGVSRTKIGEPLRYYREVVLPYEGGNCLLWPFARNKQGYGQLRFEGRQQTVSRIVCIEANGPPPSPKHEAAHSCGKGHEGCCAKRHLEWKTSSANKADRLAHGTHIRGERNGRARLNQADVREIRDLHGISIRRIAQRFGVSPAAISCIRQHRSWAWLDGGSA